MLRNIRVFGLALVLAMLAIALVACGEDADEDTNTEGADGSQLGETELTVPYVSWAGAIARTPLIEFVLEEAGYSVDAKQVEAGPMWSSVADGSSDFMTASWLPTTHASYWEQYEDNVDVVGDLISEAPLALTVPAYMEDINSIEDLKDNEALGESVDWTIVGIDPGAGIMQSTDEALVHYGLENWTVQPSSEAAMLTEVQQRMENEENIIVPLWRPHWAFAEMDLKMLEDPDEIYGGDGDRIGIVAHKDFKDKSPAAYEILERFIADYDEDLENELLVAINEGAEPEEAAREFLDENPDLLEAWLEGFN